MRDACLRLGSQQLDPAEPARRLPDEAHLQRRRLRQIARRPELVAAGGHKNAVAGTHRAPSRWCVEDGAEHPPSNTMRCSGLSVHTSIPRSLACADSQSTSTNFGWSWPSSMEPIEATSKDSPRLERIVTALRSRTRL
jgi:hypothetical protein